ncbi:HD domain-containing protein [Peptoniphilus sp. AGMB00490]|uniref:bis(5'-nucleosyl)-tetraphosphatase (symmetrical) n=1 Tax=Peptoniphilus faecalis TaxID=2731255 RepID=A0A848RJE7_9FIRM|nr:bis(5'-nucleosyl)-tetraphosphatase (symmetrical) YqeK [Peptoniphilus faecalis]NMW85583.1 HD domain-containing protein [Peptoniphilus faecalis]
MNYNLKKYESEIRKRIGEKRFLHTIRVRDTSIELAKIYHVDVEKAEVAGFLHDCAKIKDKDCLIKKAKENGLLLTREMQKAPQIIHSYLGALFANKFYGIEDEDILNAIAYHTTGRANMSDLEKIIFLADYIEPMRNFDGVEKARELAKKDLDAAMYFALNNTLKFLVERDRYIVPMTVLARNFYKEIDT